MNKKNLLIGAGLFVGGIITGIEYCTYYVAKKLANGHKYEDDDCTIRTVMSGRNALSLMILKDKVITENVDEEEVES